MDAGREHGGRPSEPTLHKVRLTDVEELHEERLPSASLQLRYEGLQRIGEGSMGTVFRGWDPRLGRAVALKLLKSDAPADTRRFLAEARAQARVQHENVCRVYEVGEADGEPYIAMELIEGASLDYAHVGMTLEQKVKVIREVAAALHEAHRLGLIHRDVKPGNIMVVTTEDGSYKPYVVDFGLARDVSSTGASTQNGIVGTPAYMSPEQAAGSTAQLDRRTDVYSLGVTLYDIIVGRTPFIGTNALTLLTKVMYEDAPTIGTFRKGVPRQLETIVMTCLQREPERRYESTRELGEDLQRFLDGQSVRAKRPPMTYVLLQKAKRNKALVIVGGIGLCIAIVLGGMWLRAAQQSARQAEIARELGEDVKYVELFLRSAYELPIHDIEREERVVRARLVRVEQRMAQAGRIGEGPGHYALGRAHLALHDYEAAHRHLERAVAAGYMRAEMHYALGMTLGGLYQKELDNARRIDDPTARKDATKNAESTFRDPALVHLRASGETEIESKNYIEGLVALYEKRYDDAAIKAVAATQESPWFYEAYKLDGDAQFEAGMVASESGNHAKARQRFLFAVDAYRTAVAIARSDAAVHEALAETWIQILTRDVWTDRPYADAFDAALTACADAAKADARISTPYARKARAYLHVGNHRLRSGQDPRPTLQQAVDSALIANGLNADDAISMDGIGNALTSMAMYERKVGLDPRPTLERALVNFDRATHLQPAFAWAWNDAGVALMVRVAYENTSGVDPRASIDSAIDRFEHAIRENGSYVVAYGNLTYGLTTRANFEFSHGTEPKLIVKRAREICEHGLAVDANSVLVLNNCGWAELVAAQYEETTGADPSTTLDHVEAGFQASLDINKDEADTQFGMGSAKHVRALYDIRQGRDPQKHFDEARTFLEKAVELDAQEPAIRLELGQLFLTMARQVMNKHNDPKALLTDAERVFREGLRVNARHAPLHAALAEVLGIRAEYGAPKETEREKLIMEGLAAAEEALAQNPKWALAMAAKGALYAIRAGAQKDARREEDTRLAIEWFDKALAINALLPAHFKNRLKALRESGTHAVALRAKTL